MSVLFVVIPIALLASAAAVGAFVWAVRHGQLDDLTTPAYRILEGDEDDSRSRETSTEKERPGAAAGRPLGR